LIRVKLSNQDSGSCYRNIIAKAGSRNVSGEGDVEMILTVDRNGKVIRAERGVRGTTTTDAVLIATANQLSYQLRFNEALTCPETMALAVTFTFKFE
jgi:hypothetical protein